MIESALEEWGDGAQAVARRTERYIERTHKEGV